jgi:demethylspheroidene O-methyltransferase
MIRVLHDHDDDAASAMLRAAHSASSTGTKLLICEPFSGSSATAFVTDCYFNTYFAAMGQGRTRTPEEVIAMASAAGFARAKIRKTPLPLIAGLIVLEAL